MSLKLPSATRSLIILQMSVCAVCLLVAGCGKSDDSAVSSKQTDPLVTAALASKPKDPVDLTQFLKVFESADSSIKLYADETVAVIRARSYRDAVEQLQKLSRNPKLTAEQRQAITDLIPRIQTMPAGR